MPQVTKAMLRRNAERSMEILGRHLETSTKISAFQSSLGVSAAAYVAAFDAAQMASANRSHAVDVRVESVQQLGEQIRGWLPQLRRDVKSVLGIGLGNAMQVPEDMLADVETLYGLIDAHVTSGGATPDYLDTARADIDGAVEAVRKDIQLTGVTRGELRALQDKTRELAVSFGADFTAFKATLRHVLGKTHPDVLALRTPSRPEEAEDEGETEPSAAASLTMAQGGIADEAVEVEEDDGEVGAEQAQEAMVG